MALFASCRKKALQSIRTDPPVQKNVWFEIYSAKDYSAPTYENVQVSLTLTAGVLSKQTGLFSKIWDTTIVNKLNIFPAASQPIRIEKMVRVYEKDQILQLSKGVRYVQNELISQRARIEPVPTGTLFFVFPVEL